MTTFNLENQNPSDVQEKQAISPPQPQPQAINPPVQKPCNPQRKDSGYLQDQCVLVNLGQIPELPANLINYEGYQFFKADPIPGQKATWNRVERTRMHLSQSELYKMVQKKANKVSAAQQYQNLSPIRRDHVNQLIHEQKKLDPSVEWSCVYAKERDRASKARNALRADYETVSMDIILMKRPLNTRRYPRTPMGDLVDLAHRQNDNDVPPVKPMNPAMATAPIRPAVPTAMWISKNVAQNSNPGNAPAEVVQGPQPRPVSVTGPFTQLEVGHPTPAPSEQQFRPSNGQTLTDNDRDQVNNVPDGAGSSSETSDDEDSESTTDESSQSDDSSSTEEAEADHMECDCEESRYNPILPCNRSSSPNKHGPISHGSQYRRKSMGRHFGRRDKPRYHPMDILTPKNGPHNVMPVRRARGLTKAAPNAPSDMMWYRIQRIDDNELRRRLLECEARVERWERAFECQRRLLQQTIQCSQQQQLERNQLYWNPPPVHHYGYDYNQKGRMDASD